jgi:hypothetical protein
MSTASRTDYVSQTDFNEKEAVYTYDTWYHAEKCERCKAEDEG